MDNVVLSIIMPVYNHEPYLRAALNSILQQNIPYPFEVLIGEDCSSDGSRLLLRQYEASAPDNYIFIYNACNLGMFRNITSLFDLAKGKYVTMLEGDDLWYDPSKVEVQIDYLENHPEYSGCSHSVFLIDRDAKIVSGSYSAEVNTAEYTLNDFLHGKLPGQTSSFMYRNYFSRKNVFQYMEECPLYPLDRFIAFVVASNGKIMHSPLKASGYRWITTNSSSFSATMDSGTREFADAALHFHHGLYQYSLTQSNNPKGIQVSEKLYFKSLLRNAATKGGPFFKELMAARYPHRTMAWIIIQALYHTLIGSFVDSGN